MRRSPFHRTAAAVPLCTPARLPARPPSRLHPCSSLTPDPSSCRPSPSSSSMRSSSSFSQEQALQQGRGREGQHRISQLAGPAMQCQQAGLGPRAGRPACQHPRIFPDARDRTLGTLGFPGMIRHLSTAQLQPPRPPVLPVLPMHPQRLRLPPRLAGPGALRANLPRGGCNTKGKASANAEPGLALHQLLWGAGARAGCQQQKRPARSPNPTHSCRRQLHPPPAAAAAAAAAAGVAAAAVAAVVAAAHAASAALA